MSRLLVSLVIAVAVFQVTECGARRRRQTASQIPEIANGDLITSIFQVPIQTLSAVRDLFQATRGRLQAVGQAYTALQNSHPNHRPNPHFVYNRATTQRYDYQQYHRRRQMYNSKALVQPRDNSLYRVNT